jgi:dimethylglycine dehydrogenase
VRVSFAGELGWEIHAKTEDTPKIYDAVLKAGEPGLKPFGMFALNSLRIEKGYRAWKGDLSTDYSLLEGGLDRFVRFDKPRTFSARQALLAEKQRGVKKRFVTLTVEAGDCDAPYMSTLWHDGVVVGETTSGAGATASANRSRSACCAPIWLARHPSWRSTSSANAAPHIVQPDRPLWDPRQRPTEGLRPW